MIFILIVYPTTESLNACSAQGSYVLYRTVVILPLILCTFVCVHGGSYEQHEKSFITIVSLVATLPWLICNRQYQLLI